MRGRTRNKGPNPLTRSYESNGPDVKIRGTAQHIAEKYTQLARDAQASGDPVAAENYLQHAEHYFRIIAAAQEALRQQFGHAPRPFDEDGDEDGDDSAMFGDRPQPVYASEEDFAQQPQPFEMRPEMEQPRPQRFERQPRGEYQGDRQDRGDRPYGDRRERFQRDRQNRFEGQGERQNRGEFQGEPRFGGERQPRADFQAERGERQDRPGRGEFGRGERRPRREEPQAPAEPALNGLPAFLTAPVRAPAPPVEEPPAAPVGEAADGFAPRPRRRRRTARPEGEPGSETVETPAE